MTPRPFSASPTGTRPAAHLAPTTSAAAYAAQPEYCAPSASRSKIPATAIRPNECQPRPYDGAGSWGYPPEQERARRFHRPVLADVGYLKSRGYNPTRFLAMIAQDGSAVTVAKRLFSSPRPIAYGFERLWEMGEL